MFILKFCAISQSNWYLYFLISESHVLAWGGERGFFMKNYHVFPFNSDDFYDENMLWWNKLQVNLWRILWKKISLS